MQERLAIIQHLGLLGLGEKVLHETKNTLLIFKNLPTDIASLQVEIEESVRDAAVQQLLDFSRVTDDETTEVNGLERCKIDIGSPGKLRCAGLVIDSHDCK